MPKAKAPVPIDTEVLIARSLVMLDKALLEMDLCIDRISDKIKSNPEYDVKDASHLAWMTASFVKQLSELRKLQDHDAKAIKNMKPAERTKLIKSWISEQPAKVQRDFLQFAETCLQERGSVL